MFKLSADRVAFLFVLIQLKPRGLFHIWHLIKLFGDFIRPKESSTNKPIKLPTALTQLILGGLFEVSNLDFLVYWPFSRLQTSET
jgi:hypothetical protein